MAMTPEQAQQILSSDPVIQQLSQQARSLPGAQGHNPAAFAQSPLAKQIAARAEQLGVKVDDYHLGGGQSNAGTLQKDQSFWQTYGPLILGAAAVGTAGFLAPALAGGGAASAAAPAGSAAGVGGSVASSAIPGGYAASLPGEAAVLSGGGAAAAGGGGWASWIPKIANVAAQVVGGINNRNAIKSAQETQQQATNAALAQQQKAQQTAGDVYNQQRADFQNMAGQPFQTLGGLLGMNIAPVGPANGRIVSTAQPMGVPQGLNANVPMETPYPGRPGAPTPELTPVPRGTVPNTAIGSTLKDIERWSSKKKSSSSYGKEKAS